MDIPVSLGWEGAIKNLIWGIQGLQQGFLRKVRYQQKSGTNHGQKKRTWKS